MYLFLVTMHVLSAMFWVGGNLFFVFVCFPVLRKQKFLEIQFELLKEIALGFRKVSYSLFIILVLTGIGILESRWGGMRIILNNHILQIKLFLFSILILFSIYHDFYSGPKVFDYKDKNETLYQKYKKISSFFGRINFLLSFLIGILGVLLSRGFVF
jgi:uncharacterized membrane protein